MKRQQGFALFISLVFMVILTFVGFGFAARGKLSSQVAKTASRYEQVTAAAEDEMYRLLDLLSATQGDIAKGSGVKFDDDASPSEITQVWDSRKLAPYFDQKGFPIFSDFSHKGWRNSKPVANTFDAGYGTIRTQSFVQELVRRIDGTNMTIQYLITVKAFAQNPGEEKDDKVQRESIAIQSLSEVFISVESS